MDTMVTLKKARERLKTAWLIVGIAILLFCSLEGALSLASFTRSRFQGSAQPDERIEADAYSHSPWVSSLFDEEYRSGYTEWRPYVYWRRRPFRGQYINIDDRGIRLTTTAESSQPETGSPAKIFMFGGSTIWGTGARDAFTIPSILARQLRAKGIVAEVTNFGETGYVSTQEVITLLLRLRQGDIPDLVIFYDGVNDTYSAYQQHVAGLPQNEFNRVSDYLLSQPENFAQELGTVTRTAVHRLAIVRLLTGLLARAGLRRSADSVVNPSYGAKTSHRDDALAREVLAREVLRNYAGNIEAVVALGEAYHFKCLFYWQPSIFQKLHLTKYESVCKSWLLPAEPLFERTYKLIREGIPAARAGERFHDLSAIFADAREPIYIDWCHLSEAGNELIATRMGADVLEEIKDSERATHPR